MCPASASTASDPLSHPPIASITMKTTVSARTTARRGSGAAGRFDVSEIQSARIAPAADEDPVELRDPLIPEI
jgi:hypothetical protein